MTTGCEVGVYNTEGPDLNIPGVFNGAFYHCVSDAERLHIAYALKKNGKTLFTRKGLHWWQTGFILGEFSQPWELTMEIEVTFPTWMMRNAFMKGLLKAGYCKEEIRKKRNTVGVRFAKPRTQQPYTRTEVTDRAIQRKNQILCEMYQEITRLRANPADQLKAMQVQAPEVYKAILNLGKHEQLYQQYDIIRRYLK